MNVRSRLSTGLFLAAAGAGALLPLAASAQGYGYGTPGGYQQPYYGQTPQPAYGQPGYGQQPYYGQAQQPAYGPEERQEYAEVIAVRPVTRTVETRQQVCTPAPAYPVQAPATQTYGGYSGREIVGGVLGAAAGGVIGHQVGGGRGRDIATVAGAIIGAGVGSNVANRAGAYGADPYYGYGNQPGATGYNAYGGQNCEDRPTGVTEQADGYDVTYRYRGQIYQTRLPYDPGTRLAVQTNVTPVAR